jgi:hypothetical protein
MNGENGNPIAELVQSLTDVALLLQDVEFESLPAEQQQQVRFMTTRVSRWQKEPNFPGAPPAEKKPGLILSKPKVRPSYMRLAS